MHHVRLEEIHLLTEKFQTTYKEWSSPGLQHCTTTKNSYCRYPKLKNTNTSTPKANYAKKQMKQTKIEFSCVKSRLHCAIKVNNNSSNPLWSTTHPPNSQMPHVTRSRKRKWITVHPVQLDDTGPCNQNTLHTHTERPRPSFHRCTIAKNT